MIEIIKDLGMKYPENYTKRKFRFHIVRCECGKEFETWHAKRIKNCKECGDKAAGLKRTKHGLHKSRINTIYRGIKDRCYNPNNDSYSLYGAKGVTMCEEWKNDFMSFYNWSLANGYKDNLCLDKDKLSKEQNLELKIYSPETCRWITREENSITKLRITKEQEEDIVSMYKQNIIIADIARKYEFTWNGIKSILKRNNAL